MAYTFPQNKFTVQVEYNGVMTDYTANVPFPIKWSDLLDEQLDEATLTLMRTTVQNFPPFVKVVITRYNTENETNKTSATFFAATDKGDEIPPGSGKYNHTLYLIEETKWLERFIIPSCGFVNALGRIYVEE